MEKFFKPNTETSRCTKLDIDRAELKDDQLIDTYNIGNEMQQVINRLKIQEFKRNEHDGKVRCFSEGKCQRKRQFWERGNAQKSHSR